MIKKVDPLMTPDMTEVVVGGGGGNPHIDQGTYRLRVVDVKPGISKAKKPQFIWKFEGLTGKAKHKRFTYYTTTYENPWSLKDLTIALGCYEDGPFSLEVAKGLEVMADIADDTWTDEKSGQTRTNSKIARFSPVTEGEGEEEEEEQETPKPNGKKKVSASKVSNADSDDLQEIIDANDLNVNLAKNPTIISKRKAVLAALSSAGRLTD